MTKPFGDPRKARIMVVGHDPRLQSSDTIANYAFFSDYYFKEIPRPSAEKRKYRFAESVFSMVRDITGGHVQPDEVLLTNLCNRALPHAPKGKTVLIPEAEAKKGIAEIAGLISGSSIKVILAMSQQVNYWLQELHYCDSDSLFVNESKPKPIGLASSPPFYMPRKPRAFLRVCGRAFESLGGCMVVPVLHAKQWPLNSRMTAYRPCYNVAKSNLSERLNK